MLRVVGLPVSAIAVSIIVAIASLGNSIVAPVLPSIQSYFGSNAADIGLMVSAFGLGRLVMDLPAGLLAERIKPARLFAVGILLSGTASAMAALSDSLLHLILFRTAMGFGAAIMSTSALVTLIASAKPEERGKSIACYTSAMLIGAAISPAVGGYLTTLFDWRAVFVFCALTPFLTFPLNLFVVARATRNTVAIGKAPGEYEAASSPVRIVQGVTTIMWPALITVYVCTCTIFFNSKGMQNALLPLYAGSVLGMGPVAIGYVLSSRAILISLVAIPVGALGDHVGRKLVLVSSLLIVAAGNLYLISGESVFIFTASTFMIAMGVLGSNMLSGMVADLLPEPLVGRGMGVYRFTCDLGTVLGPFILGLIVDGFGFSAAAIVGAGAVLFGALGCMLLVPRRTRPSGAQQPPGS